MGELSREQRAAGVAEAFASQRLDGRAITDAARRDADDYIKGRRILEDIITDVVKRHTRPSPYGPAACTVSIPGDEGASATSPAPTSSGPPSTSE